MGKRKLDEVVEEITRLIKIRKGIAPIKPRVLIIGPRGSGRNTQAELLKNHLGLVHGEGSDDRFNKGRKLHNQIYLHLSFFPFHLFSPLR